MSTAAAVTLPLLNRTVLHEAAAAPETHNAFVSARSVTPPPAGDPVLTIAAFPFTFLEEATESLVGALQVTLSPMVISPPLTLRVFASDTLPRLRAVPSALPEIVPLLPTAVLVESMVQVPFWPEGASVVTVAEFD